MPEAPTNVKWRYLGEFALLDNSITDYKARELKSVIVDVPGTFIKFVLYQNYVNRLNLCNQVGIVAINVIGEKLPPKNSTAKSKTSANLQHPTKKSEVISPLDDISFGMYVETEVAQIMHHLYARKQKAVEDERFVYAKKLKYALSELRKIGEKLGKYEIEKQQAVEAEDYDKARLKKQEMDEYRIKHYERLKLPELLEMEGHNPDQDNVEDIKLKKELVPPMTVKKPVSPPLESVSPMVNGYMSLDDSVVPALKNKSQRKKEQPSLLNAEPPEGENKSYDKLTEKEKKAASLPIDVFGLPLVEKAYSKTYSHREESLKKVQLFLQQYRQKTKGHSPSDVLLATNFLVLKALKDKVFSVFVLALDVIKTALNPFVTKNKMTKTEISDFVDTVYPEILNRMGDTAVRMKTTSMDFMLETADYKELQDLQTIPHYCLQPLQRTINLRLALGRCELVEELIKQYPVSNTEWLKFNKVMAFALNALEHPSAPVREVAERIIIILYKEFGNKVRKQLPYSDLSEQRRNNIKYRRLFDEFDRIDNENSRKMHLKKPAGVLKRSEAKSNEVARINSLGNIHPASAEDDEDEASSLDKRCMFCGEKNDKFTDKGLEVHYWKDCPMLIKCKNCKQVVEISGLNEHLLVECESKNLYDKCSRCQEPIQKKNADSHRIKCSGKVGVTRCPLCSQTLSGTEEAWKFHLIKSCASNPRCK
ncbi:centrosomal protein of 104 kDa-like [Centruroides sculpturatus]|uniref:centrosomal protein of 104 kDa-like n=1 Tax=Centruroides sculpturatus TaxID=218467 RepID=UPI000C6DF557|nr:centrosomal protein of 104 kDa-like [Centruroides sculpturatus]